ncbi:MAG: glucose 1-dehydrogenase [Deltaproteobacteria bacterium]|nr:MAG: glucose 1-dehydrogenase [Deltaproteobacteria bacterium]
MNAKDLFDLSGKVAIVTGGHAGIGHHISMGLAEMGASVVIGARKLGKCEETAEEIKRLGVAALPVACDIGRPEDVQNLVDQTIQRFGTVDILVNNAGITWGAPVDKMKLEDWERVIRTNLTGTFLCTQAVARVMLGRKSGKIINMASSTALAADESVEAIAYTSSKGGILSMTRDLAAKWAKQNIQVNCIAPGFFLTRMTGWMTKNGFEEIYSGVLSRIPMNRPGAEDDIKGVAVFLASRASDYITGKVIVVDGGLVRS